jgi:hypothetical protein
MGGHGGLNILPQKSWHVYRLDNKLKVDKDRDKARRENREDEIDGRNARSTSFFDGLRNRKGIRRGEDQQNDRRRHDGGRRRDIEDEPAPVVKRRKSDDLFSSKGINLFYEEKQLYDKAKSEHHVNLEKLLHEPKSQSSFSKEAKVKPWYTSSRTVSKTVPIEKVQKKIAKKKSIEELREERKIRENKERQISSI